MSNSQPFIDNKNAVAALFQQALAIAFPALLADDFKIEIEKPKNPDHGHFAVNSALQLAKKLGKKPRDIADALIAIIRNEKTSAGHNDQAQDVIELCGERRTSIAGRTVLTSARGKP